ncbi:MAG: GAF domain-containing sensor histidine kinase [Calditrichia bacterium]
MPSRIILLGKEEKHFTLVRNALKDFQFRCDYMPLTGLAKCSPDELRSIKLVIVDTLPFPEEQFAKLLSFRETSIMSRVPVLALVHAEPLKLRYRLVGLGVNDYLPVPFDKLDLQIRIRQLLRAASPNSLPVESPEAGLLELRLLRTFYKRAEEVNDTTQAAALLPKLLAGLRSLLKARACIFLRVEKGQRLRLVQADPVDLVTDELTLPVAEMPILVKAVRLKEATILNTVQSNNPFITYLNGSLKLKITGFMVHPIVFDEKTVFVLAVLKSDEGKFTEMHYQVLRHFNGLLTKVLLPTQSRNATAGAGDLTIAENLDTVVKQLNFGLIVLSPDNTISFLNDHAAYLFGLPVQAVVNKAFDDIIGAEAAVEILQSPHTYALKLERPEIELQTPRGKSLHLGYSVEALRNDKGEELGTIITMKDITYRKEIQEEIRTVDRLASLGVMASGIAHEIRNPLAGIKAMAQTFEEEVAEGDPKREYVQRIIRLVNRLDDLLKTLFSYAKPSKPNRQGHNVDFVLKDVLSLINQKFVDQNITLKKDIQPDLPMVYVDSGQLQQIFINLLFNAIEAMQSGGEITIAIRPYMQTMAVGKSERMSYHARVESVPYLEIIISDDGCGIAPENLKHIFNPFFTTKTFGTGLGLSIVFQLVKENDSVIYYDSEIDRGTDCHLLLPVKVSESAMKPIGKNK